MYLIASFSVGLHRPSSVNNGADGDLNVTVSKKTISFVRAVNVIGIRVRLGFAISHSDFTNRKLCGGHFINLLPL